MGNVISCRKELTVTLPEWCRMGFIVVDPLQVNMNDLLNASKGGVIVRVKDMNAIKVYPPLDYSADFAAGMISEEV